MSELTTVITMPQPTANGPLHVGHLSGPYIAADIAARAARQRGTRVLLSTGLDIHQNYVLTRAQKEGVDPALMMADFRAQITGTYAQARLSYDNFVDPQAPEHPTIVGGLLTELVRSGALPMMERTLLACVDCGRTLHHSYVVGACHRCGAGAAGGPCEACGAYTCARTLVDPRCARCGGQPVEFTATVPVLRMEDLRDRLSALWLRAHLPVRVRALIERALAAGLPEIEVAYPTDWGIGWNGLRVDPYVEVALTDLYGIARGLDPSAQDLAGYRAAWRRAGSLWHFHGIDNAFFYAIMWPALWAAAGLDPLPLTGLVTNEFYTLDGAKFSTSRDHAIWAADLLDSEDPAVVRLYLAWDRPDRYGSDFTRESFAAFRDLVKPLLAGDAPGRRLPTELVEAERRRAEHALTPHGFDPALAARCLLTLLAAGAPGLGPLRAALTGEG